MSDDGNLAVMVERVLAELRPGMTSDGYDVRLVKAADSSAVVELVTTESVCEECVLPPESIADLVSGALSAYGRTDVAITVEDRRH